MFSIFSQVTIISVFVMQNQWHCTCNDIIKLNTIVERCLFCKSDINI